MVFFMLYTFVNNPLNSLDTIPEKLVTAIKKAYTVPSKDLGHNFAAMIANGRNAICPMNAPMKQLPYKNISDSITIRSVMMKLRNAINAKATTLVLRMMCTMFACLRKASKNIDAKIMVT